MIKRRKGPDFSYPADLVWSAACAAYRINGGYFKYAKVEDGQVTVPTNRELVRMMLETPGPITEQDLDQARRCRQTLRNSVTMAALKGQCSEWNLLTARMTALDQIETEYELSVITALPKSYDQVVARENTDSRLAHCDDIPVGTVNSVVTVSGEVVRCNYSAKWNTNYVTVITRDNQQVFFAYREPLQVGRRINLRGRVKRHADRATQLSRVKLLDEEAV